MIVPAAITFMLAVALPGEAPIHIGTNPDSFVRIEVVKVLPVSWAYSSLRVTIENPTNRDREWAFVFEAYGNTGSTRESRFVVGVPAASTSVSELAVPHAGDIFAQSTLSMRVTGYAVTNPGYQYPLSVYGTQATAASGISTNLEGHAGVSLTALGYPIDAQGLPTDWRGLTGLRALVLSVEDWKATELDPAARVAVLEWVARGGHLVEVGPYVMAEERLGLGRIIRTADYQTVLSQLKVTNRGNYVAWASRTVQGIATQMGWLTAFLIGYAMLIGPVNLFVLAPAGKRARLFWTMPALSLGASVLLGLVILVQDGVGGQGRRASLVYLIPEMNREVVVQEQASRTGALLGTSFELEEPAVLYDVNTRAGAPPTKRLRSAGLRYSGDWFKSRRVQAQRLELVRPARARIERLPGAGGGVQIHSALEDRLDALYFRDAEGGLWTASNVAPGQSVSLSAVSEQELEAWWRPAIASVGPSVAEHLDRLYSERNAFVAVASKGATHGIVETLSGIAWDGDTVVYAGRFDIAR